MSEASARSLDVRPSLDGKFLLRLHLFFRSLGVSPLPGKVARDSGRTAMARGTASCCVDQYGGRQESPVPEQADLPNQLGNSGHVCCAKFWITAYRLQIGENVSPLLSEEIVFVYKLLQGLLHPTRLSTHVPQENDMANYTAYSSLVSGLCNHSLPRLADTFRTLLLPCI